MGGQSLGMIETWGYVAAVEALDAAMKAANVLSGGCVVTPSALVMVSFTGDVSAVKTAVSAGIAAARKVGTVVAHHVIPRPDTQLFPEPPVPASSSLKKKKAKKKVKPSASKPKVSPKPSPEKVVGGKQSSTAGRAKKSGKGGRRLVTKSTTSSKKTGDRVQKKKPAQSGK